MCACVCHAPRYLRVLFCIIYKYIYYLLNYIRQEIFDFKYFGMHCGIFDDLLRDVHLTVFESILASASLLSHMFITVGLVSVGRGSKISVKFERCYLVYKHGNIYPQIHQDPSLGYDLMQVYPNIFSTH